MVITGLMYYVHLQGKWQKFREMRSSWSTTVDQKGFLSHKVQGVRDFFVVYLKHRELVNYPFLPPPFFCSFNLGLLLVGLALLAFKATQPFFIWFPLEVAEETLRHKSSVAEAKEKGISSSHCIFSFKNGSVSLTCERNIDDYRNWPPLLKGNFLYSIEWRNQHEINWISQQAEEKEWL